MPALERELDTFNRERARLLEHAGKFALVHESAIAGIWDTYDDALQAGYTQYGLKPFMVKRIEAIERVHICTRPVEPACQQ